MQNNKTWQGRHKN